MNIFFFSSLFILPLIYLLLIKPQLPKTLKVPSYFLGTQRPDFKENFKMSPPPLIALLLLLFSCIALLVAYFPFYSNNQLTESKSISLVWVDRSLSSWLSLKQANLQDLSQRISETVAGETVYAVEQVIDGFQHKTVFKPMGDGEASSFLSRNSLLPFLPFSKPLDIKGITKWLQGKQGKVQFVAVTDSQIETTRNLFELENAVNSISIVPVPPYETLQQQKSLILPKEMKSAWQNSAQTEVSGDFVEVNLKEIQSLPRFSFPKIYRNEIQLDDKPVTTHFQVSPSNRNTFPLITFCDNRSIGPAELSPTSDIEAIAKFLNGEFRILNCHNESTEQANGMWRWRSGSLWLVPVNEAIWNDMQQGFLWIPKGFNGESDALVYYAGRELFYTPEGPKLVEKPLQVDKGSFPTLTFLLPELQMLSFTNNRSESDEKILFKPSLLSADGEVLGYETTGENDLPIHILRTTAALRNGELSRSQAWIRFWLKVAAKAQKKHPNLRAFETQTPQDLYTKKELKDFGEYPDSLRALNPSTLVFELPREAQAEAMQYTGLYRIRENRDSAILYVWKTPQSELLKVYQEFTRGRAEFEKNSALQTNKARKSPEPERNVKNILASLIGVIGILAFWWHQGRTAGFHFILLFALSASSPSLFAQFPSSLLPQKDEKAIFRVAWCDFEIPAGVRKNYAFFRQTLARRGTINLPKKLTPGACAPGKAEIWWTKTPDSIQKKDFIEHITSGGFVILEGVPFTQGVPNISQDFFLSSIPQIGLTWEKPSHNNTLYRSFYLLKSFSGCLPDNTLLLTARKRKQAHFPVGIITSSHFISESRSDCFASNMDYRVRSFVNLFYTILTTDYKEDHLYIPEILNRVRDLGLEP